MKMSHARDSTNTANSRHIEQYKFINASATYRENVAYVNVATKFANPINTSEQ